MWWLQHRSWLYPFGDNIYTATPCVYMFVMKKLNSVNMYVRLYTWNASVNIDRCLTVSYIEVIIWSPLKSFDLFRKAKTRIHTYIVAGGNKTGNKYEWHFWKRKIKLGATECTLKYIWATLLHCFFVTVIDLVLQFPIAIFDPSLCLPQLTLSLCHFVYYWYQEW